MKVWQCTVCKYIHKGDAPPEKCPVCGVDASKFIEIDEASIPDKTPKKPENQKSNAAETSKSSESTAEKKDDSPKSAYEKLTSLLLEHHAHPISVHTPNGVLPLAVLLFILGWMFDSQLFAKAAVINLIFVVCTLPFVVYTGILEWKNKYNSALTTIFKIKISAAAVTCLTCIIGLIWYLLNGEILSSPFAWIFLGLNIIMLAAAGVAGLIGGKLVFKD